MGYEKKLIHQHEFLNPMIDKHLWK